MLKVPKNLNRLIMSLKLKINVITDKLYDNKY